MPATLSCLQMRLFDVGIRMVENNSESQIQRVERNIRGNLKSGGAAGRAGARALEAGCGRGPVTGSTQDPRPQRKSEIAGKIAPPQPFQSTGVGSVLSLLGHNPPPPEAHSPFPASATPVVPRNQSKRS